MSFFLFVLNILDICFCNELFKNLFSVQPGGMHLYPVYKSNTVVKYSSLILVRMNKSVCVYSCLMHHKAADMLTLESWLALIRPVHRQERCT